jgi:hypothetical protein
MDGAKSIHGGRCQSLDGRLDTSVGGHHQRDDPMGPDDLGRSTQSIVVDVGQADVQASVGESLGQR